jgi:ADP-ribosylglycohydrolase
VLEDRVVGVLVGAAVGDALGAPYEFGPAGALARSGAEMQGGGGFGWEPGEWTDDTQMALHLAASLLAEGGLEDGDVFARFGAWLAAPPTSAFRPAGCSRAASRGRPPRPTTSRRAGGPLATAR